jgi:Uma2 family endonuclease
MNLQTKLPTTADEFLRWNEGREGKREFVRGRVVEMMINTSRFHSVLALRLGATLLRSCPYPAFSVGSADFAVRTPEGVRFPDLYVDRGTSTSRRADLVASEPIFLAEILSPSSYGRDFVEKLSDYTGLPSLRHYLILSQDEPRVWLWSRDESDVWSGPVEIAGFDAAIRLADLSATIPLAELYAGIEH